MRRLIIAIALFAAACQRQPAGATFDGAQTSDAMAVRAHGERLTHVLGCTGCHGTKLEGAFFTKDDPQYGPLYASNLTVIIPRYSDALLDGIIRSGTHPERKSVWAMPSQIFHNLSDADFHALVAYLRTLRPTGTKTPLPQFSLQDRKDIASGDYSPAEQLVHEFAKKQPIDLGRQYELGRYIASVTCEECHGSDLNGGSTGPMKIPNLIVAGGYSRADFHKLITTGVPTPARKLNPMMAGVAVTRFSHLTLHEQDELYTYLTKRAERP